MGRLVVATTLLTLSVPLVLAQNGSPATPRSIEPLWTRSADSEGWQVAFSPDSKVLASTGWDTKLWGADDGRPLNTLKALPGSVFSVAFSPDGKLIASTHNDKYGSINIWRTSEGLINQALRNYRRYREYSAEFAVAFSPDGRTLASAGYDGGIRIWRQYGGWFQNQPFIVLNQATGSSVHSVAFSPDGRTLASADGSGTIRLWRTSDWSHARTLKGHSGKVWSLAFSPDGKLLASASDDKTIKLWRTSDWVVSAIIKGHTDRVRSVAFSPDGEILASGGGDKTVRLWSVVDQSLLAESETSAPVMSVQFSQDGRMLAYGLQDGNVMVARNPFWPTPQIRVHGPQLAPLTPSPGATRQSHRWYLIGQLHVHWMDDIFPSKDTGKVEPKTTPWDLEWLYRSCGYHFLAPTEHYPSENWDWPPHMFEEPATNREADELFIRIGDSLEDTAKRSHVLAIGVGYRSRESLGMENWLQSVEKQDQLERYRKVRPPALCVIAHPNACSVPDLLDLPKLPDYRWSQKELSDLSDLYDGIEVYNGASRKWNFRPRAKAFDKWEALLYRGVSVFGTSGDDYTPDDGPVYIEADNGCVTVVVDLPPESRPTREHVLSALRSGSFYASYGKDASLAPRITAWWYSEADNMVKLAAESPVGSAMRARFVSTLGTRPWQDLPGGGVAEYQRQRLVFFTLADSWVRAEVKDAEGRVSFTQPIWFTAQERRAKTFPPVGESPLKQEGTPVQFELRDAVLLFPTRPSGFEEVSGEIVGVGERPRKSPPLGYMSECYRLSPDGVDLPKGTHLTIKYDPNRVGLCPEAQLALYWYDVKLGVWSRLESQVDTLANTVRAEVVRLGLFALSGELSGEDLTPPSVKLASSVPGAVVQERIEIRVEASDDNGVAVVRFILDEEVIGYDLDGADGWSMTVDPSELPAGKHTLRIEAEDASGNTSEISTELVFGSAVAGDIDGNGQVTMADAVLALRIAVSLVRPSEGQLRAGDLDGDGRISVAEAVRILRATVGIERLQGPGH